MDYSNLENKTIFDFCNDNEVLRFISKDNTLSRSEYIKSHSKEDILFDLRMLAYITSNDDLDEAIYPLLPSIIEWDNEVVNFAEKYEDKHQA